MDIVDKKTRSRMMASIRSKDTKPELAIRRYLYSLGFRYRLHVKNLPGSPDIVLRKHNLAIFVQGCFWHHHESCHYASNPASNSSKWQEKFAANVDRDKKNVETLLSDGWRVMILWECGLKHFPERLEQLPAKIRSDTPFFEWPDEPPRLRSGKKS